MPKIRRAVNDITLDTLREQPGRIFFPSDLADAHIVNSYNQLTRAVKSGRLPPPYRLGNRMGWEGRDILAMVVNSRNSRRVLPESGDDVVVLQPEAA